MRFQLANEKTRVSEIHRSLPKFRGNARGMMFLRNVGKLHCTQRHILRDILDLWTERDPVSETSCFLEYRTMENVQKNSVNLVAQLVEALCYKPEGQGLNSR
jgi:hypothetical protein